MRNNADSFAKVYHDCFQANVAVLNEINKEIIVLVWASEGFISSEANSAFFQVLVKGIF